MGAILAILNSLQFVILASFLLAYYYLYSNYSDVDITGGEPEVWRNKITFAFLIYLVIMGLINCSERSLFGIMGEQLTYKLRLELLTSILYKQIS